MTSEDGMNAWEILRQWDNEPDHARALGQVEAEVKRLRAEVNQLLGQLAHIGRVSESRIAEVERLRAKLAEAAAQSANNWNELLAELRERSADVRDLQAEVNRLRAELKLSRDVAAGAKRDADRLRAFIREQGYEDVEYLFTSEEGSETRTS